MKHRRALNFTILTIWAGAAAGIATACASGGLEDTVPGATGGAPGGVFTGGSGNFAGGSVGTTSGGSSSSSGGQIGNGGSTSTGSGGATSTTGGSTTTSGGATSSTGGTTSTNGGSTSSTGGMTSTGSGGATSNCTDTPPPNGDTCAHAVEYGWCTQTWLNGACARSCGKCSGGATGGSGNTGGSGSGTGGSGNTGGSGSGTGGSMGKGGSTGSGGTTSSGGSNAKGGSGSVDQPPTITGGSSGWASRYWDCCKPSCGWKANVQRGNPTPSCNAQNQSNGGNYDVQSSCNGGDGYACWNQAPWAVSDTLAYGYVAAHQTCGKCFQVQFTGTSHNGNSASTAPLNGKTMIVQVTNTGDIANNQFDILTPGGGMGAFTSACPKQFGNDLGAQFGGFATTCQNDKTCVRNKCQSVFGSKPDMLAGCLWFVDWFNGADNPNFVYKPIACPAAITQRSGLQDPG